MFLLIAQKHKNFNYFFIKTLGEALSKDFEKVWTKWSILDTRKSDIQVLSYEYIIFNLKVLLYCQIKEY